ncbi:MAG: hypothetical protein ACLFV4_11405, partial [Candidatus Hydrogenedentota bacterium]
CWPPMVRRAGRRNGISRRPKRAFRLRWPDIPGSEWADGTDVQAGGFIDLVTPSEGQWAAVLERKSNQ